MITQDQFIAVAEKDCFAAGYVERPQGLVILMEPFDTISREVFSIYEWFDAWVIADGIKAHMHVGNRGVLQDNMTRYISIADLLR